ncbi:hypothetical protein BGY98DRAFT_937618 [Russula aff. rugulosa BPL654]|nr:hypothetical protein BGY98DRAFT_937618 [Russula aff. rugulosa BPL654]
MSHDSHEHAVRVFAAPQLLGGVGNWCLYGALVVQFYVYSYNFPQDKKYIKPLVYSIFFLETLQTALSGADLYYWFASDFGNIERLTEPYISFFDTPILGSVVSLSVQFFFVYRIWVLSEKRWWRLCIFICLFSTVDAAAAFTNGIYVHVHGKFEQERSLGILALIWLGGNMICDLLIASATLFHLCRLKALEGTFSSHAFVSIVRLTVETNVLTTTVGVASFLMVALYPDKNWFMCPTYVLGKLYSNNLFVSLNNLPAVASNSGRDPAAVAAQTPQRTPLLFRSERKQKRWIVLID